MPESFSILFPILILAPGLFIPLLVITRLRKVAANEFTEPTEKLFARGAMVAMLVLMIFSVYAAWKVFSRLSLLSGPAFAP